MLSARELKGEASLRGQRSARGELPDEAKLPVHRGAKALSRLGLQLSGEFVEWKEHEGTGQQCPEGHRHDDGRSKWNLGT